MADMDLIFPSWTQHERIAAALESIALNGGSSDAAVLDAACKSVLDGTNTTRVFWEFYPRAAAAGETSKYKILERFAKAAAQAWNSKTYTLRSYDAAVSGNTAMTPLDDLAGKSAAQLCTASDVAVEDWADEDPMTWYIRANAMSLEDGTMNITYFEGEDGFDITGEDAPVWTFALALWIKEWNDGSFNFISFRTTKGAGFYPDAGDVAPDGTKRALTWHPSFPGGLNSSGALTSGAGIRPYNFASATAGITAARKMTIYEGLWNDCDTRWILRMWQLRHFDLENSNIANGCISYDRQYQVAKAEENVKRVILSTAQAANLIVGSTVSIGDMGSSTNKDRGQAHMRNILDLVKISSIETVTIDGDELAAVGIETESAFTTTATTYISTMPWHSGATELLPGRKDGCPHGLTNGTSPLRVAGVEVLDGAYVVGLDPLYTVTANAVSDWDYSIYECRDSQNLAGSVTSNYEDTGLLYEGMKSGWNYVKSFMKTKKGVLFPEEVGGSATTYFKSAFNGPGSAGVRCPWRFANLSYGAYAGLACGYGHYSPGGAIWSSRPRLCGAGKKRGEWTS